MASAYYHSASVCTGCQVKALIWKYAIRKRLLGVVSSLRLLAMVQIKFHHSWPLSHVQADQNLMPWSTEQCEGPCYVLKEHHWPSFWRDRDASPRTLGRQTDIWCPAAQSSTWEGALVMSQKNALSGE